MIFIALFTSIITLMTTGIPERQLSLEEDSPLFTFGVMADVHYCDCEPEETRFFRNSLKKMDEAMGTIKAEKPVFILNLGDLIDKDFVSYKPVLQILGKYNIPVLHSAGNHDYLVSRNQIRNLPVIEPGTKGYYSKVFDGYRMVILNGNEISTYGPGSRSQREKALQLIEKMKVDGRVNAQEWNGGLSDTQLKWLMAELDDAKANGQKVFIACHFPVWPEGKHVLLNQEEMLAILGMYDNIIAWFAGHDHKGGYGNYNLIHCVTFRGMVESADETSFAVVEVYRNKIWIKGYGREKSRILAY